MALVKRALLGLIAIAIGLALAVLAARSDELSGSGVASSTIVVHDAAETLARYCVTQPDGTLWFTLPGGATWQLVTRTDDPAIANPGDGAFHPFDAAEVRAALAGVRYPLGRIGAEVFVLPYPRRTQLESAAGPGLILLSPGVTPIARETQHATVTHELGHVVHLAEMPDAAAASWSRWRALRGVSDATLYFAGAPHADRPHEIFAEDFRALFGDPLAAGAGTIENAALAPPIAVPGLDVFVLALTRADAGAALVAWPNPARGAVLLARAGDTPRTLELFDVTGRRVVSIAPVASAGGSSWRWDGRGDDGRALPPGRYLARVHGVAGATVTLTRLR